MSISIEQLQAMVNGYGNATNLIYNRYQRSDYSVGQDNLNPQRELSITDAEMLLDIENMRARLYSLYKEKLEALRARDGTRSNVASDLGIPYVDRERSEAPFLLQETASGFNEGPSPQQDLTKMLGALGGLLGAEIMTLDDLPFDICADVADTFNTGMYDDMLRRPFGDGDETGTGGAGGAGAGGAGTGGAGGAGGAGAGGAGTGGTNGQGASSGATGNNIDAISDDLSCFMHELGILKLLLALVEFMNFIAKIQREVLVIVFMIVRIVTLASQAWVNPSAIAEIVQELANQGIAWASELLQQIIQMIWDSLNLDCLVKQSLGAVNEIMGSVGLVADAGAQAGTFLRLTNRALDEIDRTGTLAKEALVSKSLDEAWNDVKNAAESGAKNAILDSLNSMSAVRKVRSAKNNLARVMAGGASSLGDTASTIQLEATKLGVRTSVAAKRAMAATYETRAERGYYYKENAAGEQERVELTQEERDQYAADAAQLRQSITDEAVDDKLQAAVDSAENTQEGLASEGIDMGAGTTEWIEERKISRATVQTFEALQDFLAVDKY